jgi:hypothetical protein
MATRVMCFIHSGEEREMTRYTLAFTTFMDDGSSYLTESVSFDEEHRAIDTAHNVIGMEKWVNVRVLEHFDGRRHPAVVFDWKFYNQPEWARHILEGIDND